MKKSTLVIRPFEAEYLDDVLRLTLQAWTEVFPLIEAEIPSYVYRSFYPAGWEKRQLSDVKAMCNDDQTSVFGAFHEGELLGYIGLRSHLDDSMGEIHILAVAPGYQRKGIGAMLISYALDWMRGQGLKIAMVETGGDSGHVPARSAYEQAGFSQLPIARYFCDLE